MSEHLERSGRLDGGHGRGRWPAGPQRADRIVQARRGVRDDRPRAVPRVLPELERRLLRTLVGLPSAWVLRLAGGVPTRGDGGVLDPTVQLILTLQRRRGLAGMAAGTAEATRRRIRRVTALATGVPTPVGRIRHLDVPGADDLLPARHYAPLEAVAARRADAPAARPLPLLVFFHGGGFVAGDLDSHDEPCRLLCRHTGAHVLSVDYRLAPEHPFPAGVEDAYAVTQWALRHADRLGADPARVAVAGDSAGANLSTVACLLARRRDAPLPAAQVLLYPPTDYHTPWRSRTAFADGLLLTGEDIEFFHAQYAAGEDPNDERHSPLRSADLSGLPPALVITAAFDPLRDEGEAYADALRAAGNRVVSWRVPGMVHGFINLSTLSRTAHDAVVQIAGATRALLAAVADGNTGGPADDTDQRADVRTSRRTKESA
jgi:acetyl esterase